MKPSELIKKLKDAGIGTAEIAKKTGCSIYYINKMATGERKNPSYQIVDKLRELYSAKVLVRH